MTPDVFKGNMILVVLDKQGLVSPANKVQASQPESFLIVEASKMLDDLESVLVSDCVKAFIR